MNAFVVLSFNHPQLTAKCVASVLRFAPAESVFLVHNGSNPENRGQLLTQFPKVSHIDLPLNLGFAGGANEGFAWVFERGFKGVYFFSNDTELLRLPDEDLGFDLASALVFRRHSEKIDSVSGEVDFKKGRLTHNKDPKSFNDSTYVPGSSFFISKRAFKETGGFCQGLFTYWEDVDLSFRMRKKGLKIGHLPDFQVRHGMSKTCGNNPLYSVFFYHRNRLRVCLSHGSLKTKIFFGFFVTADLLKRAIKYSWSRDWVRLRYLVESVYDAPRTRSIR